MNNIILASPSPRRRELLKQITPFFDIIPSKVNECYDAKLSPTEIAKYLSKIKGEEVFKSHQDSLIISADTIVVLNNKIYGKPKNLEDAKIMLKELSGNTHMVITGYFIKDKNTIINNAVISYVTFKKYNKNDFDKYVKINKPIDKAGSYGVQDNQSNLIIDSYEGSLTNIIGFPVEEIKKDLQNILANLN